MSDWNDFHTGNDGDDEDYTDYNLDEILFSNSPDAHALELMWDAVTAGSHAQETQAWSELGDYLNDFYGIDLDLEWDWIDFQEWYDAQ